MWHTLWCWTVCPILLTLVNMSSILLLLLYLLLYLLHAGPHTHEAPWSRIMLLCRSTKTPSWRRIRDKKWRHSHNVHVSARTAFYKRKKEWTDLRCWGIAGVYNNVTGSTVSMYRGCRGVDVRGVCMCRRSPAPCILCVDTCRVALLINSSTYFDFW